MKLLSVKKQHTGQYTAAYVLQYECADKRIKNYEIISRSGSGRDLKNGGHDLTVQTLGQPRNDSVIALILSPDRQFALVEHEFRPSLNNYVYNLICGCVDPGEQCIETMTRETYEETGLRIDKILHVSSKSLPLCVGLTNEAATFLVVTADGTPAPCRNPREPITAQWMSKSEIIDLLADPDARIALGAYLALTAWVNGAWN